MPNTENQIPRAAYLGKIVAAFTINGMAMTSSIRGKVKSTGLNSKDELCLEIVPIGKRKGTFIALNKETLVLPEDCGIVSDMEKGGCFHGNACLNLYHKDGIDVARNIIEEQSLNPHFEQNERLIFVHDTDTEFANDDNNMEPFYINEYTGHAVVDRYSKKWLAKIALQKPYDTHREGDSIYMTEV